MGRESAACRVCMKKSKDSVELEAVFVRKPRITYLEGYNICTQLNALIGDGLPKKICSFCKEELETAYQFIEKAKEADKKLRDKLGLHRITRSSRRVKKEDGLSKDVHSLIDVETIFEEIKTEFINCSKDPLQDSEVEADEKSEDEIEMNWDTNPGNDMETDRFIDKNAATDDDEDDDDRPLKELIKKEKGKSAIGETAKTYVNFDSSDVFNDFPEPDNYSSADENAFDDKMVEHLPEPPTTAQAQIFPQGRYMCKICKKTYFTAAGLKSHIAVHMPKKKKVKRVRGPNKKSKNKRKAIADDADEVDCGDENKDECEDDVKTKDAVAASDPDENSITTKTEEKNVTDAMVPATDEKKKRKSKTPKPKKMFPCHVCGKHMISASKLRYHMVMHTGEKDYLCTICPKAYSTIYALKHHMRTHTGERPYECKFCGDKFTRPTTLKSHMRRHTGERPYGCDICGKRFIQHSSMTTHMKLNHMAKTIGCPHCDKKYARQTDLNTHLLSHTGDKPFSCELCSSRFIRQANLNKHMNQHHSQKANANAAGPALVPTTKQFNAAAAVLVPTTKQINAAADVLVPTTKQIIAKHNSILKKQQQQKQQNEAPLPMVIDVRSLAVAPVSASSAPITTRIISPESVGKDESNSSHHSNHRLPPLLPPPTQHHLHPQQQQTHMQQANIGLPHSTRNESSIPMSMNIAGIPGGIPTHNVLATTPGGGAGGNLISTHGRLESVEHLKGINPQVDNLTNLLGQVIDQERGGRSVDDLIRWNWPNQS